MCHSQCSRLPICLSRDRSPLHIHVLSSGERACLIVKRPLPPSFLLDAIPRDNALVCLADCRGHGGSWSGAGVQRQAAVMPCPWSGDQPVCSQLLENPGPRLTASFAPVSSGGTLLSAETLKWGCAGGSPRLGNRVLRFMQINSCLSAKSALFLCCLKTILAGNSSAFFL